MHISEGVLAAPVLFSGLALAAAGTGIGLRKLPLEQIGRAGLLAASFFVASLIHIPFGPGSVHLILNGMVGLLLGWGAFPAILTALTLQALLFHYGGLTVLGVNTVIMALPAVTGFYLFRALVRRRGRYLAAAGFAAGFLSVLLAALLAALALVRSDQNFLEPAWMLAVAHLPVMIIEGIVTAIGVSFLNRVHPALLPLGKEA
ncbi:MAG: cobalt transporter CbiM [Deltaproteobacteria bacterium]|nr:cobalt transporter CbiM [Deltaproteobacteria bacterium]